MAAVTFSKIANRASNLTISDFCWTVVSMCDYVMKVPIVPVNPTTLITVWDVCLFASPIHIIDQSTKAFSNAFLAS